MSIFKTLLSGLTSALLALGLTAGVAAACPSWNNPTVFGTATLPGGFLPDPYSPRITAGGTTSLARCFPNTNFTGFVISRPDFRLQYGGNSPTGRLVFRLDSRIDTVLLINAPDARWYFDDDGGNGLNSMIVFNNPAGGQYDIWTGSYDGSSNNAARLTISEF